ncbi:unnamed protein product, partial [Aphanomyces euteiches]
MSHISIWSEISHCGHQFLTSKDMGRGVKWTNIEDAQLARSWVNVSEDPIKGDDQSSDSFWGAIYVHWIAAGCEERSTQVLKNRWTILNRATQKFAG